MLYFQEETVKLEMGVQTLEAAVQYLLFKHGKVSTGKNVSNSY